MTIALAPDVQRSRMQLENVASQVSLTRPGLDPAAVARRAGAQAALEWILGRTDVGPITGSVLPVAGNLSYEAARAALAADGLGTADPQYAKGVDRILFWAAAVNEQSQPLPSWLFA